ncbi:MAG: tRNA lysidine(34) synthetase TilS [Chitinophagales bacterium]
MSEVNLIQAVATCIHQKSLHRENDKILLACSGGMDSVAMCYVYHALGYSFGIAHCNFHLRGPDSDADAAFVEALAKKLDVSFFVAEFDTQTYAVQHKLSMEEAARNLRYTWLEEIRSNFGFQYIAVAHHAGDNVETALFHFSRGTGLKGMSGIPVKNGKVIRPFLFIQKTDIETYCKEKHLAFRTDNSNKDITYRRNFIRHRIIPQFVTLNPSFAQTAADNLSYLREARELLEEYLELKKKKWCHYKDDVLYISNRHIQAAAGAETVLHYILQPYGFNAAQIKDILRSLGKNGSHFSSDTHRVLTDRQFILCAPPFAELPVVLLLPDQKTAHVNGNTFAFSYSNYKRGMHFNTKGATAYLDASMLQEPLRIRRWQKGDYLYPLGLTKKHSEKPGKKKVSDILTDAKVNPVERENALVLLCGEKIVWLCGYRQDARFSVSDKTKKLCTIKMLPG